MNTFCSSRSIKATPSSALWSRIFAVAVTATVLALPASAQLHVRVPADTPAPAPSAENHGWPAQQTNDLLSLRSASSPAEKKLSFNLYLLARKTRKAPRSPIDSMLDASVLNPDGTVTVEIDAFLSPSLMANPLMVKIIHANGGSIPVLAYETDRLPVKVRPKQLLALAANANVLSIRQIGGATLAFSIHPSTPTAR